MAARSLHLVLRCLWMVLRRCVCVYVRVCICVSICLCLCLCMCLLLSLSLSVCLFGVWVLFPTSLPFFLLFSLSRFLSFVCVCVSLSVCLCLIFVTWSEISCGHLLCALLCSISLCDAPPPPLSPSSLLHGLCLPSYPPPPSSTLGVGAGAQILTFENPVEFNGIFFQKNADTNHSSDFDPVSFSGSYFIYMYIICIYIYICICIYVYIYICI